MSALTHMIFNSVQEFPSHDVCWEWLSFSHLAKKSTERVSFVGDITLFQQKSQMLRAAASLSEALILVKSWV